MITVGLDFGTHQTKVCIENKEGVECSYSFMKFKDEYQCEHYTLPSIINVGENGLLSYGYLPIKSSGRLIRYFKQAAFCVNSHIEMPQINAMFFSCWYLAYILFDLEKQYGTNFTIQMGVPSDSEHLDETKQIAVRILASAYKLVEEVYKNDKDAFLATNMRTLVERTKIVPYSDELKDEYGILVFPEAYACLMPLTSKGKISTGMNLMIDIGGGTTDISFFTIENNKPQVYDFFSVDKGLNFLTETKASDMKSRLDSNVNSQNEIKEPLKQIYIREINETCRSLLHKLTKEFKKQTIFSVTALNNALENRPLIYSGGGSMFKTLQHTYSGFKDKKQISHNEWDTKFIDQIDEIIREGLCPILSTAYGLSISVASDNIKQKSFEDIFENIRNKISQQAKLKSYHSNNKISLYDDWDSIK